MIHRTVNLDSQIGRRRKPTNFSRRIFVHSPSRTFSVLLVLVTRFFLCRSNHSAPPIPYPMAPRFSPGYLLTALQTRNLTEGRSCPVSHRTANTVSLAIDIDHDPPYGIVVPRTHASSSLRAPNFHRSRIHVRAPSFRTRPVAHAVAVTGNMATLGSEA